MNGKAFLIALTSAAILLALLTYWLAKQETPKPKKIDPPAPGCCKDH